VSSSGPGYLPYVSKIELICRLVRRWHSTPLLNTSITRRGEIHSGATPEGNGDAMGDEIAWQLQGVCERDCVHRFRSARTTMDTFSTSGLPTLCKHAGDPHARIQLSENFFLDYCKHDYVAVTSRNLFTSKLEVECCRNRGMWMDSSSGEEGNLVAFSCRSDLWKLKLRLASIIIPLALRKSFFHYCLLARLCNSVILCVKLFCR